PHRYRVRHQLAHRRLEVVVTHHAAGEPRRPGADARLVEHHDVLAGAEAPRLELDAQVPRGGEAVHARPHDDEPRVIGNGGHVSLYSSRAGQTQNIVPWGSTITVQRLPPAPVSSTTRSAVAPSSVSRSTSASGSGTRRSMWTRDFPGVTASTCWMIRT